jgi:flagellar hook-associated protein 3 FlgL
MMNNRMLQNLNRNLFRLDKHQQQMSTGKLFNRPSDNPIGVSKSLGLKSTISELKQFKSNAETAISWLEITESAIADVGDILQRAKELTTRVANGTFSDQDRQSAEKELGEMKEQLIKLANTTYGGKYVFSGFQTNKPLLDANGNYNIDYDTVANPEKMAFEVGIGDTISVNTLGYDVFGNRPADLDASPTVNKSTAALTGTETELVAVFTELSNALNTVPTDQDVIGKSINRLEKQLDNILLARGEIGAKVNRLELTVNRIEKDTINFTGLLSKNEDADMSEVIMNYKMDESVYTASLSIGAKAIQPTLIDFIK